MNYLQLRKNLLYISGRTDLVDPESYADAGIGMYVRGGIRWLDMQMQGQAMRCRYIEGLFAGTYSVPIPNVRVIEQVWAYDEEQRWQLEKIDLTLMREKFPASWRTIERDVPKYYANNTIALAESTQHKEMGDAGFIAPSADIQIGDPSVDKGIIIMSPNELPLSLEVWGLYYTPAMVSDTDTCWWLANFESLVMDATMREIEVKHRNTQGVNDWEKAMSMMLMRIEQDQADEISVNINEMRG